MKKGLLFLLGVLVGCIITFGGLFIYSKMQSTPEQSGIRMAKQKTKFTVANKFEVFQSFEDGALATSEVKDYVSTFTGPVVFLVVEENFGVLIKGLTNLKFFQNMPHSRATLYLIYIGQLSSSDV